MKRYGMLLCAALLLCVLLCACARQPAPQGPDEPSGEEEIYTVELREGAGIYGAAGYDSDFVGTVEKDGVYSIVEEKRDESGLIWGRLKSGAGWVDLSVWWAPIEVTMTDGGAAAGDAKVVCIVDDGEGCTQLLVQARQEVHNVRLCTLQFEEDTFAEQELCERVDVLAAGEKLAAVVVFYGDMTTYGVSLYDELDNLHCYALTLSGKDGSLVMQEYIPAAVG